MKKLDTNDPRWKKLCSAVLNVWQQIGPDADPMCEDSEDRVEMCYDADALVLVGGDQNADDYLKYLCAVHGVGEIRAALAKDLAL